MKMGIKVMPRDVILDSQGRAVERSMKANGFDKLTQCRIGKFIEVELNVGHESDARAVVEKMLNEGGLYNPLIEKFEVITL